MKIKVYDNGGETVDRYTVVLGGHVYLMSADANMPNGVCSYAATVDDFAKDFAAGDPQVEIHSLPRGVLVQIVRILGEETSWHT